jgi:large subunit ribosomal protein L32e
MTEKKKPNFLRRSVDRYSKLGLRRKKKQVWRKPKGRDNKMREKRRGYMSVVSIGYGTDKKVKGMIEEKKPVIVNNLKDLEKVGKENIVVIGKIGARKKLEIIKEAEKKKIEIANVNSKKFVKKVERKKKFKKKADEEKKIETKKKVKTEKKEAKESKEVKEEEK